MELIDLKTNIRTSRGNGAARVLRSMGQIPAVLYGPGSEPVLLSVSTLALEQVLKMELKLLRDVVVESDAGVELEHTE